MSKVFGNMNEFLSDALKEAKGKSFNINEFKNRLTEFTLIQDKNEISKRDYLVDVRMNFGEPDLVFEPIINVPVAVAIHKDKAIYEIVTLAPNPNKNSDKPYVYDIQAGMIFGKDKGDLTESNEAVKDWRKRTQKVN